MHDYTIIKNDKEVCMVMTARNSRNALEMYRRKCMNTGEYWFEKRDGETILCTSFGAYYKAV